MRKKIIANDWHKEDILAAVRKRKKSLSALSREYGLESGTLNYALRRSYPRGELIIAKAIGVTPEEIWPSRYHLTKNNRRHQLRRPLPDGKLTESI